MLGRGWLKREKHAVSGWTHQFLNAAQETLWVRNRHCIFNSALWLVCSLDSRQGAGLRQGGAPFALWGYKPGTGFSPCRATAKPLADQAPWFTPRTGYDDDHMCSTVCESALSLSSDCDLEGWGWLDKFVFLEDPQSLLPSSGIAAVWVVTVLLLVILVLLEWSILSWNRGRDGNSRKRWGQR